MVHTATASSRISQEGLYFQIVCDPGHERTLRELSQLPKESRERVWADMIGATVQTYVASGDLESMTNENNRENRQQQDSPFVEEQLAKLNDEITVLSRKESLALQSALQSKVGKDPDLRHLFLRACDFDTNKTAQRMCRHFTQKLHLFGESKVGLPIRLSDLSSDDLETLHSGAIQFLPRTDRGGRLVLVARSRFFVYKRKENMVSESLSSFLVMTHEVCMEEDKILTLLFLFKMAASGIMVYVHVNSRYSPFIRCWVGSCWV